MIRSLGVAAVIIGMCWASPAWSCEDVGESGFPPAEEPILENSEVAVPQRGLQAERQPRLPFNFRPAHPSDELRRLPNTIPSAEMGTERKGIKLNNLQRRLLKVS